MEKKRKNLYSYSIEELKNTFKKHFNELLLNYDLEYYLNLPDKEFINYFILNSKGEEATIRKMYFKEKQPIRNSKKRKLEEEEEEEEKIENKKKKIVDDELDKVYSIKDEDCLFGLSDFENYNLTKEEEEFIKNFKKIKIFKDGVSKNFINQKEEKYIHHINQLFLIKNHDLMKYVLDDILSKNSSKKVDIVILPNLILEKIKDWKFFSNNNNKNFKNILRQSILENNCKSFGFEFSVKIFDPTAYILSKSFGIHSFFAYFINDYKSKNIETTFYLYDSNGFFDHKKDYNNYQEEVIQIISNYIKDLVPEINKFNNINLDLVCPYNLNKEGFCFSWSFLFFYLRIVCNSDISPFAIGTIPYIIVKMSKERTIYGFTKYLFHLIYENSLIVSFFIDYFKTNNEEEKIKTLIQTYEKKIILDRKDYPNFFTIFKNFYLIK